MKILVYPYDKNPYQKLLYSAMNKKYGQGIFIRYSWFLPLLGALHFPIEIAARRLLGYRIIHIHWIAFYLRIQVPYGKTISWYITRFNFWWIRQLGYKLIWTVHDILPHQKETSNDLDISKRLAIQADIKIIHSNFTRDQLNLNGINSDRCVVIPHGNYDGVYEDLILRKDARQRLGIESQKLVFLFFGIIKSYKGIDDLLESYSRISTTNTLLLIAGKCTDTALLAKLIEYANREDVILHNQYIDDSDVATYFKAADIVCLPFRAITTSGSTMLALTFGKPIIAPRQGSIKDLPETVGYLYNPNKSNALENSMLLTLRDFAIKDKAIASRAYADTLAWGNISKRIYDIYADL